MLTNFHNFHIVDPSPSPFIGGLGAFTITNGAVLYFHNYKYGGNLVVFGFLVILLVMYVWWRDIVREATYEGQHTQVVQQGLRYGMLLFILSEILFFFAFFWAFFHSSFSPTVEIGSIWPPAAIWVFNPWGIPLLNTFLLLSSGVSITWAHHSLVSGLTYFDLKIGLFFTIFLAILFTIFQIYEYRFANFSLMDGIYGSTFFIATGFHGFHVLIGTIFIIIAFLRTNKGHFSRKRHFGFEAAAWYWHFVDVVWLFLFISIYWWGSI